MSKLSRWLGLASVPLVAAASSLAFASPAMASGETTRVGAIRVTDEALFAKDVGTTLYNGGWSIMDDSMSITKYAVGGTDMVLLRSDGALFAKSIDNINGGTAYLGGWQQEVASGVSDVVISSTGLQVILTTGGNTYARYGVGTTWYSQDNTGTVSQVAVGGDYQMSRRSDGSVFAKYGNVYSAGGFTIEANNVSASDIAVGSDGLQMYINGSGEVLARTGIGTSWVTEDASGSVSDVATGGGVQMLLRSDGALYARSGIGIGGWTYETTNVDQIAVADSGLQVFLTTDRKLWGTWAVGTSFTCLDDSLTIALVSEETSGSISAQMR